MNTEVQLSDMIIYIDDNTGRLYVEASDRLYELEIGIDVTEEIGPSISELEVIKIFDPRDSNNEEDDKKRSRLIDDEFIF